MPEINNSAEATYIFEGSSDTFTATSNTLLKVTIASNVDLMAKFKLKKMQMENLFGNAQIVAILTKQN